METVKTAKTILYSGQKPSDATQRVITMYTHQMKIHTLLLVFIVTFTLLLSGWLLIRPVHAAGEYQVECPANGNGPEDMLRTAITEVNTMSQYKSIEIRVTGADCLFTFQDAIGDYGAGHVALPRITRDLVIRSVGGRAIIEREEGSSYFRLLESQGNLTVENLTFRNGSTKYLGDSNKQSGGAIYAMKALTLTDVFLTGNVSYRGGAVYASGKLVMDHVTAENNSTQSSDPSHGGAIMAESDLVATNITVTGNLAYDCGCGGHQAMGGGIYVAGSAEIAGATFYNNRVPVHNGGGLYVVGDLTLTSSTFISNFAKVHGGGIDAESAVTISNTSFISNVSEYYGGGLNVQNNVPVKIEGSRFVRNQAVYGGGAHAQIVDVRNSFFENNTALGDGPYLGGGALLVVAEAFVHNSRFIRNSAPAGGAVQLIFYSPTLASEKSEFINNLWVDNDAAGGFGGALSIAVDVDGIGGGYVAIKHNTFVRQEKANVPAVYVARSTVDLLNNIVVRHHVGLHAPNSLAFADGNLFFETTGNYIGAQAGAHDLTADPMFVGNQDYRLQPGSPAQDSGIDLDVATDIDGLPRPQGEGYDRGAFEIEVINAAPSGQADSYTTELNTPLVVTAPGVLVNDSDPDGDALTVTVASTAAHGELTLQPDGGFIYSPTAGFTGTDSFTYQASDGIDLSPAVAVTIQVQATDTNDDDDDDDDGPQPVSISGLTVSHDGPAVVGETVHFTASVATGSNVIIGWDFGDGARRVDPQVTHIYSEPGTYTVTTIATNTVNFQLSFTNVVVLDEPAAQQQIFTPFIVK
jgi:predicted outer membrane repeat protein